MNTISYRLLIGFAAIMMMVCMPSCNFLDLHDPDALDENKFYRDSADVEGLLASAYAALRPAYNNLFFVTEMKSDNTSTTDAGSSGGLYYTFVSHMVSSNNTIVAEIYNAFYFCIHRCNVVLEHVDDVPMSDTERERLRGEAYFLRALSHFYLTRLWGAVTIMDHTLSNSAAALDLKRRAPADVYAFIINDLKRIADTDVLQKKCIGDEFGHASKTAAAALLGKVYLQYAATISPSPTTDYNNAIAYLEQAVTDGQYSKLSTKYADLFSVDKKAYDEVIFPIMYKANANEKSNFATNFQPMGTTGLTSSAKGRGWNQGQWNLYDEIEFSGNGFAVDDAERFKVVKIGIDSMGNKIVYTTKYLDLNKAGYGGNLWYELRFADVFLMLAEAYERVGNTSQAIANLNKVRQRSGFKLKTYEVSQTNAAYVAAYPTLRDAIFHERRMELCFENQRWFDLQRLYPHQSDLETYMHSVAAKETTGATKYTATSETGKYTSFLGYEALLPIPYDEVFLNPGLGQNLGY